MGTFCPDYPERVYAGWLGKIIGIRLGAPIESMSYQKIRDFFGIIDGYLIDYNLFAADDDSNGPLFLIRALPDSGKGLALEAQDIANALLNYAPYEHGFFWWGGYGISTEHTAYLNLRRGIPAPKSGSIEVNGRTVAEQIGGQIFSDCWGLVCPGRPDIAASLAAKASSVSHDGNAVYGGQFVAAAISLAFVEPDIMSVVNKALLQLPETCEYRRMAAHIIAFHHTHPENWRECLREIQQNYGYDKYSGACHVIPNAAVMILSLLYGSGNFDKTLEICCMCGWDTDCNAGNVGTMLGVLNGIQGISYGKWRAPIQDFLACSSVLGSLNLTDIPAGASLMARCGYNLFHEDIPARWSLPLSRPDDCYFAYPGSTHAMRVRVHTSSRFPYREHCRLYNTDELSRTCGRSLKLYCCRVTHGQIIDLYRRTYLYQSDFQDNRYSPAFSPIAYPGEKISGTVCVPAYANTCTVSMYVGFRSGKSLSGPAAPCSPGKWVSLTWQIPSGDGLIDEAGFRFTVDGPDTDKAELCVLVDSFTIDGQPNYSVELSNETEEYWSPSHQEITQFTQLKGLAKLQNGALSLSCEDFEEVYTGKTTWDDYTVSCQITPVSGPVHLMLFRVQGAMRSYAFGFRGQGKIALLKNSNGYSVLTEASFPWKLSETYHLSVCVCQDCIRCAVNGEHCLTVYDTLQPYLTGAIGLAVQEHSSCMVSRIHVEGNSHQQQ